ncbi:hypothetical protein HPB51_004577 [Rhipicephalus microplus]|uniref:THAP-type domain-containing protein n=1 Tax=Rhipicephalus microplus TaxID=6941 RepID=A0A9J6EMU8_RHIMP|nr:hypothetical protein HPB51_004577 [Rhipicephalus microplus]
MNLRQIENRHSIPEATTSEKTHSRGGISSRQDGSSRHNRRMGNGNEEEKNRYALLCTRMQEPGILVFEKQTGACCLFLGCLRTMNGGSKWDRNLRRKDKALTETSAVCERHFEERFILRNYVHVVNGQEVRIPRDVGADGDDSLDGMVPRHDFHMIVNTVSLRPLQKALELDGSNVTLQAMSGITRSHTNLNNFEKMRVLFAFQVFGDKVLNGLRLYETELERNCGGIQPVLIFFGMIRDVIEIMTSRFPRQALRPDSALEDKLLSFLTYLTE